MPKKITKDQKEEIRDKIDRLNHLKEDYVNMVHLSFPIFVTIMIFIIGIISTQTDRIFDIKYNITFTGNLSNNLSSFNHGIIEPVKNLNLPNFGDFIFLALFAIVLLCVMFIVVLSYVKKYTKYNDEITTLYYKLTGIKEKDEKKVFCKLLLAFRHLNCCEACICF